MSDFDDARTALDKARQGGAEGRNELLRARQDKARIDREIERLSRTANSKTGTEDQKQIEALKQDAAALDQSIDGLKGSLKQADAIHADQVKQFAAFSDPIKGITN